jgi:hypothetical protein
MIRSLLKTSLAVGRVSFAADAEICVFGSRRAEKIGPHLSNEGLQVGGGSFYGEPIGGRIRLTRQLEVRQKLAEIAWNGYSSRNLLVCWR